MFFRGKIVECLVLIIERFILINPRIISILPRPPVFSLKLLCINNLIFSRPHVTPHVRPHLRPHVRPHVYFNSQFTIINSQLR